MTIYIQQRTTSKLEVYHKGKAEYSQKYMCYTFVLIYITFYFFQKCTDCFWYQLHCIYVLSLVSGFIKLSVNMWGILTFDFPFVLQDTSNYLPDISQTTTEEENHTLAYSSQCVRPGSLWLENAKEQFQALPSAIDNVLLKVKIYWCTSHFLVSFVPYVTTLSYCFKHKISPAPELYSFLLVEEQCHQQLPTLLLTLSNEIPTLQKLPWLHNL